MTGRGFVVSSRINKCEFIICKLFGIDISPAGPEVNQGDCV